MKKMKLFKKTAALLAAIMCLELSAGALGDVHYESSTPIGMNTSLHESIFTYSNDELHTNKYKIKKYFVYCLHVKKNMI